MQAGEMVRTLGLRSWHLQSAAMGSVALCTILWMRATGVDQEERGNAERRALFVGLWVPTLWLMSQSLRDLERHPQPRTGGQHPRGRTR